jgi:hypothetical protein
MIQQNLINVFFFILITLQTLSHPENTLSQRQNTHLQQTCQPPSQQLPLRLKVAPTTQSFADIRRGGSRQACVVPTAVYLQFKSGGRLSQEHSPIEHTKSSRKSQLLRTHRKETLRRSECIWRPGYVHLCANSL